MLAFKGMRVVTLALNLPGPVAARHFQGLGAKVGVRNGEEYRQIFATRSAAAWQEWGQQLDVPIAAVR